MAKDEKKKKSKLPWVIILVIAAIGVIHIATRFGGAEFLQSFDLIDILLKRF